MVIDRIETVAVRFPSSPANEAAAMDNLLRSTFPGKALTVSLDRLIASVQARHEMVKPVPWRPIHRRFCQYRACGPSDSDRPGKACAGTD